MRKKRREPVVPGSVVILKNANGKIYAKVLVISVSERYCAGLDLQSYLPYSFSKCDFRTEGTLIGFLNKGAVSFLFMFSPIPQNEIKIAARKEEENSTGAGSSLILPRYFRPKIAEMLSKMCNYSF